MQALLLLEHSMILPEEEMHDYEYYVSGISKEQLIAFATFLVSYSEPSPNNTELNLKFFYEWFGDKNREYANFIYSRVYNLTINGRKKSSTDNYRYSLFNAVTSLKLTEFLLTRETIDSYSHVSFEDVNIRMFKLLLRFNSDYNALINVKNPVKTPGIEDIDLAYYITLTLPNIDIINANGSTLICAFVTQLAKSSYLFDFLTKIEPILLKEFLSRYACTSVKEYYGFFKAFLKIIFDKFNSNLDQYNGPKTFTVDADNESFKNFVEKFLVKLNLSTDELDEKTDFQYLRSHPIVKYADNTYCIISKLFIIQKLYNGIYFELNELYNKIPVLRKQSFRSLYTYNFSEKYLLYTLMQEIYEKRGYKQFSGDQIADKYKFNGGPDYYIRNGKYMFLFENKDVFLNGKIKTSYDFLAIKDAVDEKLVKDKGIPQVIKNIKFALDKKFTFDNNYKPESCYIYPIIVTHRAEFDAHGMNFYLGEEFNKQLEQVKKEGYDISHVKGLTIMNIDILLLSKYVLKDKRTTLNEIIDSYHQFIRPSKFRIHQMRELNDLTVRMFVSFNEFMLSRFSSRKISYNDEMLRWIKILDVN